MSDLGFPGSGGGGEGGREGSLYALDQALNNVHSIKFTSLGTSCGMTISMQEFKFLCHCFPYPNPESLLTG